MTGPVSTQSFEKNDIVSRTEFFHSQFTPKKLYQSIDRSVGAPPILEKNGGKIEPNSQGSSPWLLRNWCLPLYDNGTHEPSIISFDGDEIGRSIQNRIRFVSI